MSRAEDQDRDAITKRVRADVDKLFDGWVHYDFSKCRMDLFAKFDKAELTLGKEMGRGQFGVVCSLQGVDDTKPGDAKWVAERKHIARSCIKEDKTPRYAVKCVNNDLATNEHKYYQAARDLAVEAHFLAALDHPNIIKMRGLSTDEIGGAHFFVILDMLAASLKDRLERWNLKERKLSTFSGRVMDPTGKKSKAIMTDKLKIGHDLINAISFLHKNHILHRDIKPENVGFDAQGELRLFDFGLSLEFNPEWEKPYNLPCNAGTMRYMAPEFFLKQGFEETIDVYAFGIILWEILAVRKPFSGMSEIQFKEMVMKRGQRPEIDKHWPEPLKNLIEKCWAPTFQERPSSKVAFTVMKALVDGDSGGVNKSLRHSAHEQRRLVDSSLTE
jgi:serine/threonine protein kinase